MNTFVFIYVALAGIVVSARFSKHIKKWKGYEEGDKYFYFPGEDGKIHLVDATEPVDKEDMKLKTWEGYHEGDRYFYFPSEDGKIHKVDRKQPVDRAYIRNFTRNPNNIGYWLYTRSNPKKEQLLKMGDKKSVLRSYFNPKQVTVFISHGWTGSGNTDSSQAVKDAFVKKTNMNVIVIDWSEMADTLYCTATAAVPKVGKMVGEFISWLSNNFRMSLQRVHLVGHSLGGHLIGCTGRALDGKVKRITALDPALPLWLLNNNRIAKTDGQYVEVIHTNVGFTGYPFSCGHSDHYPNGGCLMPGCYFWDIFCNHGRAWKYMASSIEYNHFAANKCHCRTEAIINRCTGRRGYMGNSDISKQQSGIYRVNTKKDYPYF